MAVDPTQNVVWTFQQLGGNRESRTLGGWQAPFGRRRQKSLLNAGVKLRTETIYYPGDDTEPTVNVFGSAPKPWELNGRFMDSALAISGGALTYRRQWYDFVRAAQPVRATWGPYLSYRMLLEDIDLEIESATDIAWRLKTIVIADEGATAPVTITATQSPADIASQMNDSMDDVNTFSTSVSLQSSLTSAMSLFGDIEDSIGSIVDTINTPFSVVFDLASNMSDFQTAVSSDLGRLQAGTNAMKSGLAQLRDSTALLGARMTLLDTPNVDTNAGVFSAADILTFATAKIAADLATANLLALIADMNNQIDLVNRGIAATAYQAQAGDTWESIGGRQLGSADAGRAIRSMNGIRFGQQPVPGKLYSIPRSG